MSLDSMTKENKLSTKVVFKYRYCKRMSLNIFFIVKAGWGDWAGPGNMMVSNRIQKIRDYKISQIEKEEEAKKQTRMDKAMPNVVISERRIKTAGKYVLEKVPHPFTSREEYESSLQMPLGEEWNAANVYRANTKPELIVRSGRIIEPLKLPKGTKRSAEKTEIVNPKKVKRIK